MAGTTAVLLLVAATHAGTALITDKPLPAPDAIVSLASHEWERLPKTAALAHDNPAAIVVLTLPNPVTAYNCHDCGRRVEWLAAHGVSATRVRVVPIRLSNTYGEAIAVRAFANTHPLSRLTVVTSPYHTRRALATFEKAFEGAPTTVGVTPATTTSPATPDRWWARPYDRWYVVYEWAAIGKYAFAYGVLRDVL